MRKLNKLGDFETKDANLKIFADLKNKKIGTEVFQFLFFEITTDINYTKRKIASFVEAGTGGILCKTNGYKHLITCIVSLCF